MIAEIQGNGWMLFERLVEEDIRLSGIFHPPALECFCVLYGMDDFDGRNSLITQLRLAGLSFPEPFFTVAEIRALRQAGRSPSE